MFAMNPGCFQMHFFLHVVHRETMREKQQCTCPSEAFITNNVVAHIDIVLAQRAGQYDLY